MRTATAPARTAGFVARARRAFDKRSLPQQIAGAGLVLTALGTLVVGWLREPELTAAIAAAAAGAAATALAALLAHRSTLALRRIAVDARALRRDDASEADEIALAGSSNELHAATLALRRMTGAMWRRRRELEAQNVALADRLANRTHELETLQDLSIGLATKSELHELVDEALGALEQTLDYASASLWTRGRRPEGGHVSLLGYRTGIDAADAVPTNLAGMRLSRANLGHYEQIERERMPLIENQAKQSLFSWLWSKVTDDARSSALYRASRSWMAVPLKSRDEVLGVMRVDHHESGYFDPARARLLTAVASQTALAMRHAELLAQERDVAVTAERNRIARDLHDAVSQTLFAATVVAGTLAAMLERDPPAPAAGLAAQARSMQKLNRGALSEMRLLMMELRPDALEATPLAELLQHACEALAGSTVMVVEHQLARGDKMAPEVRVQLYRIAQEALSNISKHSGAGNVMVAWTSDGPGRGLLRIADDGHGFDASVPAPGHFGLGNMKSRAAEIGATLAIVSAAGEGTELRVEIAPPSHAAPVVATATLAADIAAP